MRFAVDEETKKAEVTRGRIIDRMLRERKDQSNQSFVVAGSKLSCEVGERAEDGERCVSRRVGSVGKSNRVHKVCDPRQGRAAPTARLARSTRATRACGFPA